MPEVGSNTQHTHSETNQSTPEQPGKEERSATHNTQIHTPLVGIKDVLSAPEVPPQEHIMRCPPRLLGDGVQKNAISGLWTPI